jgi:acetoin:2,6-dichlorophenolindophenol oxidoreductase subunit alpha
MQRALAFGRQSTVTDECCPGGVVTSDLFEMYRRMVLIREVETTLVRLFAEGRVPGFIHSYIGEEASAVGVCSALPTTSYMTSTHRGHGHILAKDGDLRCFFAELYGKASGYCRGKGGSMHVTDLDLGILGANGIVGAGIPIAAGAALASRLLSQDRVAVAFFGDGATDIGVFHEALNMASLWELPAIFVCENNGYAEFMSQRVHQRIERISDRAASYLMPGVTVDGNDVEAVHSATAEAVARARAGGGPTLLECVTYRLRGHYEGDPEPYRTETEIDHWRTRDPLAIAAERLRRRDALDDAADERIRREARAAVEDAVSFAEAERLPSPEDALEDVHAGRIEEGWRWDG